MAVLYRKYRPQTFAQVVGQRPIVKTLQNQILAGNFAHAYLFTGSRGVGKTSVARILAKAVNCVSSSQQSAVSSQPGDACGECSVCKAIEAGNFIDLIEIDAASNTGVDNVRDIIEHVKFAPSLGKYKVFIVDEVHMLSKGAFNALLKTLEEPPKHAIFILATTEIQKVPATIISRTQRFDFKILPEEKIIEQLKFVAKQENLNYSEEVFALIAQNSLGSARDALSILDKITTLGNNASAEDIRAVLGVTDSALLKELFEIIALGKAEKVPEFFDRLLEKGADFGIFNKDFLEYLRKLLVQKITQTEQAENLQKISVNDLMFVIRLFLKSFKDLQNAFSPEIPLLLAGVEAALKQLNQGSKPSLQTTEITKAVLSNKTMVASHPKDDSITSAPVVIVRSTEGLVEENKKYDDITLSEVNEFWPKVVAKIKEQNGPLGSLLKAAPLHAVLDGKIIVLVKYQFDKKTLEKNLSFIMEAIKETSGKSLGLIGNVPEETEKMENPVAALSDALKIFGGEIIE